MYKIKVTYKTGDSFSTRDTEGLIEHVWTNLEVAKQNLKRIQEHYAWYESTRFSFRTELPKPSFAHPEHEWSLKLLHDDGQEFDYGSFWIGMFETLYGLEIILDLPKVEIF